MVLSNRDAMKLLMKDDVSVDDLKLYLDRMISNVSFSKREGYPISYHNLKGQLFLIKSALDKLK